MKRNFGSLFWVVVSLSFTCSPMLVKGQHAVYPTKWINPVPDLYVVAYGNGEYVAAGAAGVIQASPDGSNWTDASDGAVTNDIYALSAGGGRFVAAGAGGLILTSTNGANWVSAVSPTTNTWLGAAYGGGLFALVGQSGSIAVSSNGVTWRLASSGVTNDIPAIAYGNGTFAAIEATNVLTSGDGVNWSAISLAVPIDSSYNLPCQNQGLNSISFGNGQFYLAGVGSYTFQSQYPKVDTIANLRTSVDGTNWTFEFAQSSTLDYIPQTSPVIFFTMVVEPDFILASGVTGGTDNQLGVFTHSPTGGSANLVLKAGVIASGNSLAASANGFVAVGASGFIAYSPDATNWTQESSQFPYEWDALLNVSNLYLGGVDNGILASSNGSRFFFVTNNPDLEIDNLAFANGRYVAVGDAILVSSDGISWSTRNSGVSGPLTGICWAGNQFITAGYNAEILTSPTGDAWTERASGTSQNLYAVSSGGGLTVAVGAGGTMVTSPDGVNWTAQYSQVSSDLDSVTYAQGQFVAVGVDGGIVTSPDGVNWTPQSSKTTATLRSVLFDSGKFFAVGDGGTILTSANGSAWTPYAFVPALNIKCIAPTAGGYLLGADNGDMVQIGQLGATGSSAPEITTNSFGFTFQGVPQQGYRLQYSLDLSTWLDLFAFTNTVSTTNLVDASPLSSRRFYRVVAQ